MGGAPIHPYGCACAVAAHTAVLLCQALQSAQLTLVLVPLTLKLACQSCKMVLQLLVTGEAAHAHIKPWALMSE